MKKENERDEIKVEDRVKTCFGEGVVIVIDPRGNDDMPFLVEIEGWHEGHAARRWWEFEWYPDKHKTKSSSRGWFSGKDLEKV